MKQRLFVLVAIFSAASLANPDVIFSDSAANNGVYLKHELNGEKIKFLLSENVPGFALPDEYFSVEELVDFLEKYEFTNEDINLHMEFLRMLRMSIESKFTLKEFMTELLIFLDEFKRWPKPHGSDGCSSTGTSYSLLLFACLLYCFNRISRYFANSI